LSCAVNVSATVKSSAMNLMVIGPLFLEISIQGHADATALA
jgi:hypothetical protein